MDQAFDPLNLLILAIAVVILFRLRSVLGRRTGTERPPIDPFPRRRESREEGNDNVIPLPQTRNSDGTPAPEVPVEPVWKGFAPEDSPLARGLETIAESDKQFTTKSFLDGAKMAYEMVVTAFASGDRATLKNLLSRDVLDGFSSAIDAREKEKQTLEQRFVGFDKADLVSAELRGKKASIAVRFVSELISATRDKSGAVIDGDPTHIREVTEIWTFERDTSSRDPNWKLTATEAPA
ncbi:Tim44/TimA family putative adaptor protein [soil metagenome]